MAPHILARECAERDNRRDVRYDGDATNSFALRQRDRGISRVQSFAIILKRPTGEVSAQSSIPLYMYYTSILTTLASDRRRHITINFIRVSSECSDSPAQFLFASFYHDICLEKFSELCQFKFIHFIFTWFIYHVKISFESICYYTTHNVWCRIVFTYVYKIARA